MPFTEAQAINSLANCFNLQCHEKKWVLNYECRDTAWCLYVQGFGYPSYLWSDTEAACKVRKLTSLGRVAGVMTGKAVCIAALEGDRSVVAVASFVERALSGAATLTISEKLRLVCSDDGIRCELRCKVLVSAQLLRNMRSDLAPRKMLFRGDLYRAVQI